jgi:hypothetical protein
MSPTNQGGIAS